MKKQDKASRKRWLILGLWLLLFVSFWLYLRLNGLGPGAALEMLLRGLSSSPWGGVILIGIFLLRPLLLLPITILNVFAGFLFGPLWGFVYATLATLASCSVAYLTGRYLSSAAKDSAATRGLLANLKARSFETVLISRLMFIPGDLVNYAAGALRVPFLAFVGATALGGAPGLLVTVLAGAATEGQFSFSGLSLNRAYLVASALLLVTSVGVSFGLRRRTGRQKG